MLDIFVDDHGRVSEGYKWIYRFWDPQPDYSAFREASYGHSTLEVHNRTHAIYRWNRNDDGKSIPTDSVVFHNQYWYVLLLFSGLSILWPMCRKHSCCSLIQEGVFIFAVGRIRILLLWYNSYVLWSPLLSLWCSYLWKYTLVLIPGLATCAAGDEEAEIGTC